MKKMPTAKIELPQLDMYVINQDNKSRQTIFKSKRKSAETGETLSLLTKEKIRNYELIDGVNKFTPASIITLIGGSILLMTTGLAYALGTISPYIVSYYRIYLGYDVNYDTFYPLHSLTEISCSIVYPLANFLVMKVFGESSRPALIIGAIVGIGMLFCCVALKLNPYLFILMYASGLGIIKGFYKQCSLIAGWSHLGGRKGLVSGLILGGVGIGGSLYGLYYHSNIALDNVEPVEDKTDG